MNEPKFTTNDRRAEIIRQGKTIASLARKWGYLRKQVSMCVNNERRYPAIRLLLAQELGIDYEKFWGESAPSINKAARKAA